MDDSPEVRIAEALESIAEALGILAVGAGRCRSATSPLPCLHTWGAVGVGPRGCPGHQCREPRDHRGDHVCAWCDAVDAPRVSVQAPDRLRAVMEQHAAAKPIVSVCNPFDPEEARVRKLQTELNERLAREQRMADAREAAGSPVSPQPPGAVGAAPLTADDINAVNAPGSIAETFRGKVHVRRPGETWAYFQERIRASPVVGGAVPEFARCPFEWAAVDTLQCRLSSKRHRCELPAGHGGGLHQCGACSVSVPVAPDTRPTRCLTQWPWGAVFADDGGGACGPDATVGGLRAECHHRCAARVGHQGLCRCECGKLQTTPAVDVQLTVDDIRHLREQAMDAALDEALQPRVPTWRPIETAPRDGTKVLMRVKGGGDDIILAKWDGIHWRLGQTSYDRTMLTHWCPLPVMP